jgi:hypothetical protein
MVVAGMISTLLMFPVLSMLSMLAVFRVSRMLLFAFAGMLVMFCMARSALVVLSVRL